MRLAYADPPYLGCGKLYPEHPEALVWDEPSAHGELMARLDAEYDGWALSLSVPSLRDLLPLAPSDARMAAWVKTYHQIRVNIAVQYAWEPVLFRSAREPKRRNPLVRDWHSGSTTLSDPTLIGSKPPKFCRWVLDLLGFEPDDDTVDDVFPGSGVMGRVLTNYQGVLA